MTASILHELAHWKWFTHRHDVHNDVAIADLYRMMAFRSEPSNEAGRFLEDCLFGSQLLSTIPVQIKYYQASDLTLLPQSDLDNFISPDYWKSLSAIGPIHRRDFPIPSLTFVAHISTDSISVTVTSMVQCLLIPHSFAPPFFLDVINATDFTARPPSWSFPQPYGSPPSCLRFQQSRLIVVPLKTLLPKVSIIISLKPSPISHVYTQEMAVHLGDLLFRVRFAQAYDGALPVVGRLLSLSGVCSRCESI